MILHLPSQIGIHTLYRILLRTQHENSERRTTSLQGTNGPSPMCPLFGGFTLNLCVISISQVALIILLVFIFVFTGHSAVRMVEWVLVKMKLVEAIVRTL